MRASPPTLGKQILCDQGNQQSEQTCSREQQQGQQAALLPKVQQNAQQSLLPAAATLTPPILCSQHLCNSCLQWAMSSRSENKHHPVTFGFPKELRCAVRQLGLRMDQQRDATPGRVLGRHSQRLTSVRMDTGHCWCSAPLQQKQKVISTCGLCSTAASSL